MNNELPAIAADVSAERARALHRVVRALHDGHCPNCGALFELEKARRTDGERCAEDCGFYITHEEADAALKEFQPYMKKNVDIFLEWRKERQAKNESSI